MKYKSVVALTIIMSYQSQTVCECMYVVIGSVLAKMSWRQKEVELKKKKSLKVESKTP